MNKHRAIFLKLSSELTGYSTLELEGTGLVDQYKALVEEQIGPGVSKYLYQVAGMVVEHQSAEKREELLKIDIIASPSLWPVCAELITLWYRGQWSTLPELWYRFHADNKIPKNVTLNSTIVPSAEAYTQQLSYIGAGAHPPGANPTGYGSWAMDPVFGDFTHNKIEES